MEIRTINITALLQQAGDPQNGEAWEQLYQAVEGELRLIAESLLKRYGQGNHALQATVLIDEALIRLVAQKHEPLEDRK